MKIIITFILAVCSINAYSQKPNKVKGDLPEILSHNCQFNALLDSMLIAEKSKAYYDDDLLFSIRFIPHSDSCNLIQIEPVGKRISKFDNELGGFKHKNHIFIVYGSKLDNNFFKLTDEKLSINYGLFQSEISEDGTLMLDAALVYTDIYSVWIYKYCGNNLELVAYGSPNDPDSFNNISKCNHDID